MRVAVVGGTGLVGRQVLARLPEAGADAVSISRRDGVDLVSGVGLDAALEGVDAVIDVSNVSTIARAKAMAFFSTAAANLAAAAARAGVPRIVVLSIVGVDRIPFGYYEAKLAQEVTLRAGAVPVTVLRATQFHEFADQNLRRVPGPVALIPRMRMRPVASSEVADDLVRLALSPGRAAAAELVELAGPEQLELVDLARRVSRARRLRKLVVPMRVPGAAGGPMASGALLPQGDHVTGSLTFDDWLTQTL